MVRILLAGYFIYLMLSLSSVEAGAIGCPTPDAYAPCACGKYSNTSDTIFLDCANKKLSDSNVSNILDLFIMTPGLSPLGRLDLYNNQLTRVPSQIKFFPQLEEIRLFFNAITSVESGAFNFIKPTTVIYPHYFVYLELSINQLVTIAPGAFKGNAYGNGTEIFLFNNNLTRFESTVFLSVLKQIAHYGGFPFAYILISGNLISCDCHLTWLIRDNRHLLPSVYGGFCSNGTTFEDLDPNGFANCPSFECPPDDGYYADPLDCTKYYVCILNVPLSYDCQSDLVFNPEIGRCDAVANVPSCQQLNSLQIVKTETGVADTI